MIPTLLGAAAALLTLGGFAAALSEASRSGPVPLYAGGVDVLDQWRRPADIWRQP